jgi:membrane-bound serine protease (ClpP class)
MLAVLFAAQSPATHPPADPAPDPPAAEASQPSDPLPIKDAGPPPRPTATASTQPAVAPTSNLALPSGTTIAVIPITGVIYDFTLVSLERRVEKAVNAGASVIVIELDTPGGVATSALKISKYIKNLQVPTVAWVHNEAYSAGIMIAAACDEIVMSPASATGDCAPIVPGRDLAPTERAKYLSPILEEFRDSAQANGYDYALFHAMCVLGVEVYLIEKDDGSGERRLVNQVDFSVMVNGESAGDLAGPSANQASNQPANGDVGAVTLTIATESDRGAWRAVELLPSGATLPGGRVHDGKTLLTLNQTRAGDIGLSKAAIGSQKALQQHYRAATVLTIPPTWSEGLAAVLTSPWVRVILIVVFLLGAYIEMQAPGLSVPGAVAAVALLALIGAPFVIGLAEVWHILLFILGFILLIVEIVFTPSFGLLGVAGLMMMFMGVVLSVVPSGQGVGGQGVGWLPPPEMWDRLVASMFITLFSMLASGVGFYYITKHFGSIPGINRLILNATQPSGAAVGLDVTGNPVHVSGDEVLGVGVVTVGITGRAVSELRPSGMARFGDRNIDVVSVGPFIAAGQPVKVVEVHGNRIVVDEG